jgi:hypothetical protein
MIRLAAMLARRGQLRVSRPCDVAQSSSVERQPSELKIQHAEHSRNRTMRNLWVLSRVSAILALALSEPA